MGMKQNNLWSPMSVAINTLQGLGARCNGAGMQLYSKCLFVNLIELDSDLLNGK